MKLILTIYFGFMLATAAYSQDDDQALVKVNYTFSHIRDTTARDKPYTENMLLLAGKNVSYYTSYDRLLVSINLALLRIELDKSGLPREQVNAQMRSTISPLPKLSEIEYYTFLKERISFNREQAMFNYLVEDKLDSINWKILKDTLSFSGIHCRKAITFYKGRNWIAWFATDLPFASGPWKLHDAPGLIIEAYDDKKEVEFKFAGIQKVKPGDLIIDKAAALPAERINNSSSSDFGFNTKITLGILPGARLRATRKDFEKIKKALGDSQGFGGGGGGGGFGGGGVSAASAPPARAPVITPVIPAIVINNPIELPATK